MHILDRLQHIGEPGFSLSLSDFEAQVRFIEAQPPPAFGIVTWPAQELGKKERQCFNRTSRFGEIGRIERSSTGSWATWA